MFGYLDTRTTDDFIKFFGASLDALDIPEAVGIKRAYIEALSSGKFCQNNLRDPYALFQKILGDRVEQSGHQNFGRFLIESWLTPKPQVSDMDLIRECNYTEFLGNDGFRVFAELLRDFVKAHIFPQVPGMIGVDHSSTGGILMALSERFGPETLGVLVFDAHTDAVPLHIRSGLSQYAGEKRLGAPPPLLGNVKLHPYTAGDFLYDLMEKEIILPENLIIVGAVDSADRLRNLTDKRVLEYVRHCDSLSERKVKIVTKDQLLQSGPSAVRAMLDKMKCINLYVSLDVDVCSQCGVLASRFMDNVGTEAALILEVAREVEELLSGRFSLVGLDIMEIDIHKVGATLSEVEDQTEDFVQRFVSIFMPDLGRQRNQRSVS